MSAFPPVVVLLRIERVSKILSIVDALVLGTVPFYLIHYNAQIPSSVELTFDNTLYLNNYSGSD